MKIKLDYEAVMKKASEKNIDRLSHLCIEAGVNYCTILNSRSRSGGISLENAWLISEYLGCPINAIVKPDWTT